MIEFRTQEGELSKLSINPEVSQEERDQLAQLTVPSGQRFGYSSIVILLSPYNEVLEEAKLDNGATLFSSSIRYKGKEINLGLHGSKIIDGKCIVKWGPQNQLRNYIEDPEFTETVINPRARSFIRGILADGGLDLPDAEVITVDSGGTLTLDMGNYDLPVMWLDTAVTPNEQNMGEEDAVLELV
ncbi:MAG: hypothetical protein UT01_C0038G0001, partial [Candidatus Daviesbacteria bacterium GW2011_GWA1_38_7]